MSVEKLRERCYALSERLSWVGVGPDIAALKYCELLGLLAFLQRVAGAVDGTQ